MVRKKWKWVKDNPFSDVEFPLFDNQRDRWLIVEEEQRLVASAKKEWLRDIITFVIHTGCRTGEILSVTWKNNIDMSRRFVVIKSSKGGVKKVIPMSNILYGILKRRLRISHISGRIFPVTRDVLKDAFRKVVKRLVYKTFIFHDFRHTFATRLVQAGKDLYVVQKLLRHKTIRMTERYAHHYPDNLRASISALDDCYNFATVPNFDTIAIDAKH